MGSIIKILILYKTPFWREKNFSGEVVSDCLDGPAFNVYLIYNAYKMYSNLNLL
jgi:monoamine oxidase